MTEYTLIIDRKSEDGQFPISFSIVHNTENELCESLTNLADNIKRFGLDQFAELYERWAKENDKLV
jgi:hypothetical protein